MTMGTDQDRAKALEELADGQDKRSKAGQLRALYDQVVKAQQAGVSNADIVAKLKDKGLDLTIKSFETMMYRIRKSRKSMHQEGGTPDSSDTNIATTDVTSPAPLPDVRQVVKAPEEEKPQMRGSLITPTDIKSLRNREVNLAHFTKVKMPPNQNRK